MDRYLRDKLVEAGLMKVLYDAEHASIPEVREALEYLLALMEGLEGYDKVPALLVDVLNKTQWEVEDDPRGAYYCDCGLRQV